MTTTAIITAIINEATGGPTHVGAAAAISNEDLWQAVVTRDKEYDGRFVYAVRSTGIYCRPTCPSRRPRREQASFFTAPTDARMEGYRACLRCLPDGPPDAGQSDLVRRACEYIREYDEQTPTLAQLGAALGASPSHLQRVFKHNTGLTPRQYAAAWKMERFKSLVKDGEDVSSAMYDAGFSSPSRLYENSEGQLGMTPAAYRKGAPGVTIYHAVVESPLGRLLVAATERGICSVKLGATASELTGELQSEFPAAKHLEDADRLGQWMGVIVKYLEGSLPRIDLPLDVRATAFQRRVWQLLQSIPYGETRTYQEVAQELGLINSSRAVGRACASNPTALVVPCHRVLRKDGGLGGYRWGLDRKEALLALESRGESRGR